MKKIFSLFALAVFCIVAYADVTLPPKTSVGQPKVLHDKIIKESNIQKMLKSGKWGQSSKESNFWTVYSDREKNITYNGPSESSGKYATLEFNEKLRIAKIEGDWALVYDEKHFLDYPAISKEAVSKGWIPMKNLLLWESCPTNEVGIYNKALIVMNLDEIKAGGKGDIGKRYLNPVTRSGAHKLYSSMKFYFVMKKGDNGLVLLATECKMTGYTEKVLYGWVSTGSYIPWNQRTCLEPNWKPAIAAEFEGKTVSVYKNKEQTSLGCSLPLGRKNRVTDVRSTMYRMGPYEMRYPLLDNDSRKEALYKVTAFARPDGSAHVAVVPESDEEIEEYMLNDKLKSQSVINLIVIIDGTSSMEKYYPPTQEIIQRANEFFGKENGKNVRVGIVIYRDYADGAYVTEHLSMRSPTDPSVADFLKKGGQYGIKSSRKDHTSEEALYKGLEVALDTKTMGYSPDNSNLMFVIGDCGNDIRDKQCLSLDEIVNRCVQNRVQVSSFQVRNKNEQAYLMFRSQMSELVRKNMKIQYGKLGKNIKAGFKELSDGYEFKTNLPSDQNFYIGSTRNASLGKDLAVTKLYDMVKNSYMQFDEAIRRQLGVIHNTEEIIRMANVDPNPTEAAQIDMNYLKTIFTEKEINALMGGNDLMAFQGYANKKSSEDLDYWQPVIYISSDEFASLMEQLKPVMAAANEGSVDRKPYVNAIKQLIRTMLPDITESEMDEKSPKEVMALISGLNEASQSLKGKRTLVQIQNENIVKQVEFDGMIAEFKNKYNKLKSIREQKYPFSIERNKTVWYWIPIEDLP